MLASVAAAVVEYVPAAHLLSGAGLRIPDFGFRVSSFEIRDSNFGFRVSGFGFGDYEAHVPIPAAALKVPAGHALHSSPSKDEK